MLNQIFAIFCSALKILGINSQCNFAMDKKDFIKNWRRQWLFCLFELSHLTFQWKLWVESAYPDIKGDFDEGLYQYFVELGLEKNYVNEIAKGYISKEEYNIVFEFHKLLAAYYKKEQPENPNAKVLKDPKWIEISEFGLKVWSILKSNIQDKDEMDFIYSLESEYLA